MRKTKYNRGLTLIEMLFSLAILGMVLAIGYSIFSFSTNTHQRAETQSELQHDTLKVADFITQALHGATEVQILASANDVPEVVNDDYNYIYLYQTSGTTVDSVVFKNKNGMTSLVNQYTSDNNFILFFQERDSGKTCYYRIDGDSGTQSYNMESKVKLENKTIGSTLVEGAALKFKIDSFSDIQIFGTSIDDTVGLIGTAVDSGNNSWKIVLSYVTIKAGISSSDIEITGLPSGLGYNVTKVNGFTLLITVTGTASSAISGVQNLSIKIKPTAVVESNARRSESIPVKLVPSVANTFSSYVLNENVFVYGTAFKFSGGNVIGDDATIVVKGGLTTSDFNGGAFTGVKNIYIDGNVILDGGSAGLGSTNNNGSIYINGNLTLGSGSRNIYGNVYVAGNLSLKDAIIHGDVYVGGNVVLNWTPTIDAGAHIYYMGTLTYPASMSTSIISKCVKVSSIPSIVMPDYAIPPLKADSWYADKGYDISAGSPVLADNKKILATANYSFNDWKTYEDVVIVGKGNITLKGNITVTGVIFAPYGKITFGGASFTGIMIARDGVDVTSGGSTVTFKNISNYFSDPSDYPF